MRRTLVAMAAFTMAAEMARAQAPAPTEPPAAPAPPQAPQAPQAPQPPQAPQTPQTPQAPPSVQQHVEQQRVEVAPPGGNRVIVQPRPEPAFQTIARDTLFGALTGAFVGSAVLLIARDWDNWDRYLGIGTGTGVLVGAGVGVVDVVVSRSGPEQALRDVPAAQEPATRDPQSRPRGASLGFSRRF